MDGKDEPAGDAAVEPQEQSGVAAADTTAGSRLEGAARTLEHWLAANQRGGSLASLFGRASRSDEASLSRAVFEYLNQAQGAITGVIDTAASSNSRISEQQRELLESMQGAGSDDERLTMMEAAQKTQADELGRLNEEVARLAEPLRTLTTVAKAFETSITSGAANERRNFWLAVGALVVSGLTLLATIIRPA